MNDPLAILYTAIVAELQHRDSKSTNIDKNQTKRLAQFLNDLRFRLGYSQEAFINLLGQRLNSDATLIRVMLEGNLPEALLEDEFLLEIAYALDYEPEAIWAALERSVPFIEPIMSDIVALPSTIGKRYDVIEWLGAGSMGSVYAVRDRLANKRVALKWLATLSPDLDFSASHLQTNQALALANEFRLLASLHHPHIIHVLDYGFEAKGQPYFTMELLDRSQNILEHGKALSEKDKILLAVQLFQGLAYLHRCGILHRDLKPSNILVIDKCVKILDFGLSAYYDQAHYAVGTPKYLAPELITGSRATQASDLYSAGIILYELLAGHYPFMFDSPRGLLDAIVYEPAPTTLPEVDGNLQRILNRLLAKRPEARYVDANEVVSTLAQTIGYPLSESVSVRESFLQSAPLVERETEITQILDTLEQAKAGQGSTWLLGGESGCGKSRLCAEIAIMAQVQGAMLLSGQAVDNIGYAYHLWHDIVQRLALTPDLPPHEAGTFQALVPSIQQNFDFPIPTVPLDTPEKLAKTLIAVIQRQFQVIVIILEDLHWAEETSLAVLKHLSQAATHLPLLIIGNYRDNESPDLPQYFPFANRIKVQRLSSKGIATLGVAMLGNAGRDPRIIQRLQQETEGNVFFLVEMVRALAEESGGLDKVSSKILPQKIVTRGIQTLLERYLSRIPEAYRELLQGMAILGRQPDLAILKVLYPNTHLESSLAECARSGVLEIWNGSWRFAHDKLREGILEALSLPMRQTLHQQAALAIESIYSNVSEHYLALAYHWGMADDPERGYRYALLAGEQALAQSNFRQAVLLFQRALRWVSREAETAFLHLRLGDAYRELFKHGDAKYHYEISLETYTALGDQANVASILTSLGSSCLHQAFFEEAKHYFQQSYSIYQSLGNETEIARLLGNIGRATEYHDCNYAEALRYYHESLTIYTRLDNKHGQGVMFNNMGNVCLAQGKFTEANQWFQKTYTLFQEIGHTHYAMMGLFNLGIVAIWQGRYEEAEVKLHTCLAYYREQEIMHSSMAVMNQLGLLARNRGFLAEALQNFQMVRNLHPLSGAQLGGAEILINQGTIALIQENYEEALRLTQEGVALFRELKVPLRLGDALNKLGFIWLEQGDLVQAQACLDEAAEIGKAIGGGYIKVEADIGRAMLLYELGKHKVAVKLMDKSLAHPACYAYLKHYAETIRKQW